MFLFINIFFIRDQVPVMVISLGRLSLKSEPTSDRMNVAGMHTSGLTSEDIMRKMLEQAYDKFTLEIQNIQVSV